MKNIRRIGLSVISGAMATVASSAWAADDIADDGLIKLEETRKQVEQKLSTTFANFKFYSIKESPVEGMYEIDTGSDMIYYAPDNGVLIFGKMYNEAGENLTEVALAKATAERMKDMDLSVALEFGPEDAPVLTEFSNPDCGYCQRLHDWLDRDMRDTPVRRKIIFTVGHSRSSQDKAEHILCSEDPEKAFNEIYERRGPRELLRCDEGYRIVRQHIEISTAAGVSGTPTLIADGQRIRGFDRNKIEEFLTKRNAKENRHVAETSE